MSLACADSERSFTGDEEKLCKLFSGELNIDQTDELWFKRQRQWFWEGKMNDLASGCIALFIGALILAGLGYAIINLGYSGSYVEAYATIAAADCQAGNADACEWRPRREP